MGAMGGSQGEIVSGGSALDRPGHFLKIHLRGKQSSRAAIGATVKVEIDGRTMTRQLTAGDGYQASNERVLTIGIGTAQRVSRLQVEWPSGRDSEFSDIEADGSYLADEGEDLLLALP